TAGLDAGITLKDAQKLLGSGKTHPILTTKSTVKIPAFSRNPPLLTSSGDVITLANGNQISGLNLLVTSAGGTGITGTNIKGSLIKHNWISGSVDHRGVFINGVQGN